MADSPADRRLRAFIQDTRRRTALRRVREARLDITSRDPAAETAALLARSLRLQVFVAMGRRLDESRLAQTLPDHIRWVISLEQRGQVMLCGPLTPKAGSTGPNSLLVLRAESLAAAEALAAEDPLVRAGVMAYELREWTIYEGALPVRISLSDGSARL